MATTDINISSSESPIHSGAVYDSIMQRVIDANPIVAAKALEIARVGGDTEAAIQSQLSHWHESTNVGITPKVERAFRALVEYFQAVRS